MDADERRFKTKYFSAFIWVHRRLDLVCQQPATGAPGQTLCQPGEGEPMALYVAEVR